jgi:hypothetical protein
MSQIKNFKVHYIFLGIQFNLFINKQLNIKNVDEGSFPAASLGIVKFLWTLAVYFLIPIRSIYLISLIHIIFYPSGSNRAEQYFNS